MDGVLDEGGYGAIDSTTKRGMWLANQNFIVTAQAARKVYYAISSIQQFGTDEKGLAFALASYLMSKGHSSGVYYGKSEVTQWLPEYDMLIGLLAVPWRG